jgi:hypothetical protein
MSFTLVPKYGESREVNVWVWRPMLALIRDAKLMDEKSYKKMGLKGYSVGREWLQDFGVFSRDSVGFGVF